MSKTVDDLNREFKIENTAIFKTGPGSLTVLEITNAGGSAEIALHGAQVMSFTPSGQPPVLWMSQHSHFQPGKPMRGGIPICWPWFSAHPFNADLPAHGFARIFDWEVVELQAVSDKLTTIKLTLPANTETRQYLQSPYRLEVVISVGEKLDVALITVNTGSEILHITNALHSYFNVSDISLIKIHGLDGRSYADSADQSDGIQQNSVIIDREVDRVYFETEDTVRIEDTGLKRSIYVGKRGSRTTVVWNPWIDKSIRMPDFGEHEYLNMVCVETANTHHDAVDIKPGEIHLIATFHWSE